MKVAVLGASGGMGSFFARYFQARGATVRGADPSGRKPPAGSLFATNRKAVEGCDVTILAVPMDATLKVAREVVGRLKEGSTLVEISSVKGETPAALRRLARGRAVVLSIHPLFGPALESTAGMKVAVIAEGGGERERALAERLFPDARVIPMTRKEHDEAMAVVLSLTHMINLVYASTAAKFLSPEGFMRVSTPNSSMQLTIAEAVLAQDPRLSFGIQAENAYTAKVGRAALAELERVLAIVEESDWGRFEENFSRLAKRYKTKERARAAVREIYSAAEKGA